MASGAASGKEGLQSSMGVPREVFVQQSVNARKKQQVDEE